MKWFDAGTQKMSVPSFSIFINKGTMVGFVDAGTQNMSVLSFSIFINKGTMVGSVALAGQGCQTQTQTSQ